MSRDQIVRSSRNPSSTGSISETISTNKVIRQTYMLLSVTLAFSAVMAFVAMAVGARRCTGWSCWRS